MGRPVILFEVVTAILGIGVLVWVGYSFFESGVSEPPYTVIKKEKGIEIREYQPVAIAKTRVKLPYRPALNTGFRRLANYIFGGNYGSQKVPMTAPVFSETAGESIPMTAPVLSVGDDDSGYWVSFVLPEDMTVETAPKPLSDKVILETQSWGRIAAIRFSGYADKGTANKKTARLAATLNEMGLTAIGPYRLAQYNSPWVFPFLRRNEVLVQIKK